MRNTTNGKKRSQRRKAERNNEDPNTRKRAKNQRSERRAPHGLQGSCPFDKHPHV
jgi:hypothetical protein